MIFRIRIANQIVEIHSLYEKVYSWCKDYVVPFNSEEKASIIITPTQEDIAHEDKLSQYISWRQNPQSIMVYHPAFLETRVVYKKISDMMPLYSVFLMHGSVVEYNGRAYIFAAPSGTGKTTRTAVWLKEYPGSVIVNGDKPLIRVSENYIYAYGTPWCGKENCNTNMGAPVQAIFLLDRSNEGEPDSIKKLRFDDAFPELIRHIYHPIDPTAMKESLSLLKATDGKVDIYRLRCSPTPEAIHLAYETAKPL